MKRLLPLLGWLVAAPALVAAGAEFEARLWSPDLAGAAQVGGGGGTALDLGRDLGLGDGEALAGRLIWRPTRRTSLRLSWAQFDFAGETSLDRTVSFAGSTFRLDSVVTSLLDLELARLGFAWQPIATGDGRLRLGPLVEARGLRGEAAIRTDLLGILPLEAREEFELAFAAAGLVVDIEPTPKLHIYVEASTSIQSDEGDLTDSEAGLRYYPIEMLALTVGYRRLEVDFADRDETYRLELDGPFFGAVLRF